MITRTITYTYPLERGQATAANRLTNIQYPTSGEPTGVRIQYTWDDRGNLRSDGIFTYTYPLDRGLRSAAGRMVRAESVTATLP